MIWHYLIRCSVIALSLVLAMCLTVLPMPEWANTMRPMWVLLVLIYWVLALPHRINIGVAWCCGLVSDILYGSLLGEHAFVYTIIIACVYRMHVRMRLASGLQQSLTVFALLILHETLLLVIHSFSGQSQIAWTYWLPCLSSTVLWTWLFLVLRGFRRRFQIS